jgi:hypothetical protein
MKIVLLLFTGFLITTGLYAQEEFIGPLPGWVNIKTVFGAKGDGVQDDTKCMQRALDSLTQPVINYNTGKNAYMVIYLPAGTYCISATLKLDGKIGVSFIGESPASTIFKWKGKDSATMFLADGSAYFKVSRLTWDANSHKGIEALGIHWKTKWADNRRQSSAPVNIEISDNQFIGNCRYGISGGTVPGEGQNQMDSEISIRRCVFKSCTEAGIHIKGYNALDYWVWDCQFLECRDGINSNYGNYHVYRSYFRGSKLADLHNTNGYYISVRGCYSDRSYIFSHDEGASSNPFKRIFQSNIVIAPSNIPIELYHLGKISLIDNQFDAATHPAVQTFVQTGSWAKGNYEIMSLNNTYKDKEPIKFVSAPNKIFTSGDTYGVSPKKTEAAAFINSQEKMPLKKNRVIITVPTGAGSKKIQELIVEAVRLKGKRPVLYFPFGKYLIDQPLQVPAGADLQVTGDGYLYASVLLPSANFPLGQSLIQIDGPTSIVIRDIQLGNFTSMKAGINGIQFRHIDQANSQAFIEQLYTNSMHSIDGDGLDYLYIQETNSFYSFGNSISGGLLVQRGKGTAGLYTYGGQFAGASVDKNSRLVAKDCWWEGTTRKPLDFTGKGFITIDGVMIAPDGADSNTTVAVNHFSGNISLMNMYLQGGVSVEPLNPNLNLLFWNIHFYHTLDPLKFITVNASYKAAFIGLTTQCFIQGNSKCADINTIEDVFKGGNNPQAFLTAMQADDRAAMPRLYTSNATVASNIFISRVSAGDCITAIRFSK